MSNLGTPLIGSALVVVILANGCSLSMPFQKSDSSISDAASYERLFSLARLHERHQKAEQAIRIYERILEQVPGDPASLHRLGVIAAEGNDLQQAIRLFNEAKAGGLSSADLLADLGYATYLMGDLAGAERYMRRSLELAPDSRKTHNNLAMVLAEMNRNEEALQEFLLATSEAAAHANLAYVQSQRGSLDSAKLHYHRALELDPGLRPAAEALVQLVARTGNEGRVAAARGLAASSNQQEVVLAAHSQPVQLPPLAGNQHETAGSADENGQPHDFHGHESHRRQHDGALKRLPRLDTNPTP